MQQPRVIAVAMQKGGVGKTSITVNLAAAMANRFDQRVYLADFDGQCNTTEYVLPEVPAGAATILDVLRDGRSFAECALPTAFHPGLSIVPGSEELAYMDRLVAEAGKWDVAVKEVPRLIRRSLPADADIVLIDTPPSLGLWLQIALGVADDVVIVAKPEKFSVQGMRQLVDTVQNIKRRINPRLSIAAVILNNVRTHTLEHSAFVEQYRAQFGSRVLSPVLPERTVIPESQREGVPVEFFQDRKAPETREFFHRLAGELLERVGAGPVAQEVGA